MNIDDERERTILIGVKINRYGRDSDIPKLVGKVNDELRLQFGDQVVEVWRME